MAIVRRPFLPSDFSTADQPSHTRELQLQPVTEGRERKRAIRKLTIASAGACAVIVAFLAFDLLGGVLSSRELDRLFVNSLADPILVAALRDQNAALSDRGEAWALEQDREWRAERDSGEGPLQRAVMDRPASRHLSEIVSASGGLIGHAFLIDSKGRIAAAPFPSFNFWQFDKPKFHYTFPLGPGGRDVSWLQNSWDGAHTVCWRAQTFVDPASREPIGVLAFEVNYLKVGRFGCAETPAHTPSERATNHVSQ